MLPNLGRYQYKPFFYFVAGKKLADLADDSTLKRVGKGWIFVLFRPPIHFRYPFASDSILGSALANFTGQ